MEKEMKFKEVKSQRQVTLPASPLGTGGGDDSPWLIGRNEWVVWRQLYKPQGTPKHDS